MVSLKSLIIVEIVGDLCIFIAMLCLSIIPSPNWWVPFIVIILLFIFGCECFLVGGYETLFKRVPANVQGIISNINQICNYSMRGLFCPIFGWLAEDGTNDDMFAWCYGFLAVASLTNIGVALFNEYLVNWEVG